MQRERGTVLRSGGHESDVLLPAEGGNDLHNDQGQEDGSLERSRHVEVQAGGSASERRGNNSTEFNDFDLEAKASIWS